MEEADMSYAVFEPASNPNVRGIAAAKNLELLTFRSSPDALVALRKQFQDFGFRAQERKLTFALMRRGAQLQKEACSFHALDECTGYAFSTAFFDWTCAYGMEPQRPLKIIVSLVLLLAIFYFCLMQCQNGSGIYLFARRTQRGRERTRILRIQARVVAGNRGSGVVRLVAREWRLSRTALCFSVLTAFTIGFREFNIGQWLRMTTKQEYELRPVGWARTVSGLQSLVSGYMLALWVLTYFGRPFG